MEYNLPPGCSSRELRIDDRESLSRELSSVETVLSEYSFANLYLFRERHSYRLLEWRDHRFLAGIDYNTRDYLMPLSDLSRCDTGYLDDYRELGTFFSSLFPLTEEWCDRIGSGYRRENNPDDNDYVYLTEKFIGFPGKKMQKKRNHLNRFTSGYQFSVAPFGDDSISDAVSLLDLWIEQNGEKRESVDYRACREAFEERDRLTLDGFTVIIVENGARRTVGLALGERIGRDVTALHFAKADISVHGIYQFLFSEYARLYGDGITYINLEQDLGKEGLRKTKHSYHPALMGEKFRLIPERPANA